MTSTNRHIGGVREEIDYQKLGPALLIAASLVLAVRTARWPATHSEGLADVDWRREVEHGVRVAKAMLLTRFHIKKNCFVPFFREFVFPVSMPLCLCFPPRIAVQSAFVCPMPELVSTALRYRRQTAVFAGPLNSR